MFFEFIGQILGVLLGFDQASGQVTERAAGCGLRVAHPVGGFRLMRFEHFFRAQLALREIYLADSGGDKPAAAKTDQQRNGY